MVGTDGREGEKEEGVVGVAVIMVEAAVGVGVGGEEGAGGGEGEGVGVAIDQLPRFLSRQPAAKCFSQRR